MTSAFVVPEDAPAMVRTETVDAGVDEALARVRAVAEALHVPVQALRAGRVLGPVHVAIAHRHALRATRAGRARARDVGLELVVFAAAERQIQRAVAALGLPAGAGVPVVLVALEAVTPERLVDAATSAGWPAPVRYARADEAVDVSWWDGRLGPGGTIDERLGRLLGRMALLALDPH